MKKVNDEQLITAILTNGSQAKAAKELGINTTTITKRLKNPEFRRKLNDAKGACINQAVYELRTQLSGAVKTLSRLMNDENAAQGIQLQAADALLRHGKNFIETVDHEQRLRELEDGEQSEEL